MKVKSKSKLKTKEKIKINNEKLSNDSCNYYKNTSAKSKQMGGNPLSSNKDEPGCKNTKVTSAQLYYIQSQIDKANEKGRLGTLFILDNPITKKQDINYWVSTGVNDACDVLEYNKLERNMQFEKAYRQIKKDQIYDAVSPTLIPVIDELNYKLKSPTS